MIYYYHINDILLSWSQSEAWLYIKKAMHAYIYLYIGLQFYKK